MKADSLCSILDNYLVLNKLWNESVDFVRDSETRSRIWGVTAHMANFDYFFGISVAETILQHCNNLGQTLQPHRNECSRREICCGTESAVPEQDADR